VSETVQFGDFIPWNNDNDSGPSPPIEAEVRYGRQGMKQFPFLDSKTEGKRLAELVETCDKNQEEMMEEICSQDTTLKIQWLQNAMSS